MLKTLIYSAIKALERLGVKFLAREITAYFYQGTVKKINNELKLIKGIAYTFRNSVDFNFRNFLT